ncbi:hypothetical protein HGA91_05465 [candidate division WWE3 bacterium]|nr:hypothetical protein [candidate division WWE3 bacterium]
MSTVVVDRNGRPVTGELTVVTVQDLDIALAVFTEVFDAQPFICVRKPESGVKPHAIVTIKGHWVCLEIDATKMDLVFTNPQVPTLFLEVDNPRETARTLAHRFWGKTESEPTAAGLLMLLIGIMANAIVLMERKTEPTVI